jgi:hypothetical protein
LGDARLSSSARCVAARSLGRLNYNDVNGIDVGETAVVLAKFLVDAAGEEHPGIEENDKLLRRWGKQCISSAIAALAGDSENRKGISVLAKDAQAEAIAELRKAIDPADAAFDNKKLSASELAETIHDLRADLTEWLNNHSK